MEDWAYNELHISDATLLAHDGYSATSKMLKRVSMVVSAKLAGPFTKSTLEFFKYGRQKLMLSSNSKLASHGRHYQ
jgi:hypothetical protein